MRPPTRSSRIAAQRGVTLIIVMLILVVVTILGIGGARIALLGERSTRFDRDYLIASQAAESALMDAQTDINNSTSANSRSAMFTPNDTGLFIDGCGAGPASPTSSQGLCNPTALGTKPAWAVVDFTDTSNTAVTVPYGAFTGAVFSSGLGGIRPELPPRYIIEVVPDNSPGLDASQNPKLYRITAIGFGPRKEVQVVLQTAYRKPKG
jgi:type IV pilus assembly protein PilX